MLISLSLSNPVLAPSERAVGENQTKQHGVTNNKGGGKKKHCYPPPPPSQTPLPLSHTLSIWALLPNATATQSGAAALHSSPTTGAPAE